MSNHFAYHESAALITGASRGIGAEIARVLCERGVAALVLTARAQDELDALSRELKASRPDVRVEVIQADLSQADAPQQIWSETTRRGLTIDLLVNNAGFGATGAFESVALEKDAGMVAVNIDAVVKLTHLFLPAMLAQKRGGVINVASTAAFQPVPFMATYGATKAFVLSFSEALWAEAQDLKPGSDIRIVCLCPGNTESHFADGLNVDRAFEASPRSTPREVALAACHALDVNASYHVVGTANYFGTFGARIMPRAPLARITARLFRPQSDAPAAPTQNQTRSLVTGAAIAGASLAVLGVALAVSRRKKSG